MTMTAECNRNNLVIIDVYGPPERDLVVINDNFSLIKDGFIKPWGQVLYSLTAIPGELCALDTRKTTDGDSSGINIVIEKVRLSAWKCGAEKYGLLMKVVPQPVKNGHYGEGEVAASIVSIDPGNENCFWVQKPMWKL